MHTVSKRRCFGLEPMMDEDTMIPASAAVNAPQRGRRRSPAPVPPPHARYDPSAMLFSLAMTSAHPTSAPASAQPPHRRQQTPSGGNGTFRGRRRYRSPSLSMSSSATAIRKAPSRSNSLLQSKTLSMSKSQSQSKSRPTSPLSPDAGSRGRSARGDSPSPRRVIFRATVDMDHGYPYFHSHHYQHHQPHQHHHAHLQPFSVKKVRRAHCPSRPGSVDGNESRRRARTRSRPRHTRDAVSEVAEIAALENQRSHPIPSYSIPLHPTRPTGHVSQNSHISVTDGADGASNVTVSDTASITLGHTRCHMPLIDSSGISDGDAMDIEH